MEKSLCQADAASECHLSLGLLVTHLGLIPCVQELQIRLAIVSGDQIHTNRQKFDKNNCLTS